MTRENLYKANDLYRDIQEITRLIEFIEEDSQQTGNHLAELRLRKTNGREVTVSSGKELFQLKFNLEILKERKKELEKKFADLPMLSFHETNMPGG